MQIRLRESMKSRFNFVTTKVRVWVSLALSALLLTEGCKPKTATISGDVFIVTKGGQNLKLGLVQVSVFTDSVVQAAVASQIARAHARLPEIDRELDSLSKEHDERLNAQRIAFDIYLPRIPSPVLQERFEAAQARSYAALNEWSKKKAERANMARGDFYIDSLSVPLVTSKTDADGKFTVQVPVGRVALAAHASRSVGERTEEYYWLIWTDVDNKGLTRVMLSNDNLFETRCATCYRGIDVPKQ